MTVRRLSRRGAARARVACAHGLYYLWSRQAVLQRSGVVDPRTSRHLEQALDGMMLAFARWETLAPFVFPK
jgi:hypothetical protein